MLSDLRNHYNVHYQPDDSEQTGSAQHLEKHRNDEVPDVIKFTIVSTLNRRAEQEKKRGKVIAKSPSDAQRDIEKVQTILADLSEFPLGMNNTN